MKHSVFEKWSRVRMERAILILSLAFGVCFFALTAVGCVSWHSSCTRSDTAASMTAADILRLQEARLAGDENSQSVYTALIRSRISACLDTQASEKLSDILGRHDEMLEKLCNAVSKRMGTGICTAEMLSGAITEVYPTRLPDVSADAYGSADFPAMPVSVRTAEPAALAEKFFGVKFVFRAAGSAAFCDNLYARFDSRGGIREFAGECLCEESTVSLTEEECLEIARQYAAEQFRVIGFSESVRFRDGICWVEFVDAARPSVKLGIRGDTGRVCFCMFQQSDR